jgi:hypothetical protein
MSGIMSMLLGAVSSAAAAADEFFNRVTLLLNTSSTNGAQNNTFLDSSSNNFTITRNGNTTQGTFTPFSQTGWSNFATATSASVGLSNSTAALVSSTTTTFTAECWIYMTEAPVSGDGIPALIGMDATYNTSLYLGFGPNASRQLVLRWFDGSSKTATGGTALALNTWYHIAVVSNANAIAMYVNGVAETLSGTTTLTNRNSTTNNFSLFLNSSASNYQFRGYASNIRVCTSAVYTGAFTPSTTPLTTTSQGATNCKLLTAQGNRFVDNSTNAYALTVQGTPSVQAFSPFAPTAAYDAAVVGGSGYFDGTGDYLSVPANAAFGFATGDFTWEGWLYISAATNNEFEIWESQTTGSFVIYKTSSGASNAICYRAYGSADNVIVATASIPYRQWFHLAVSRSSGTIKAFLNGVQTLSQSDTTNFVTPTAVYALAARDTGTNPMPAGFISNVRVLKGTGLYTAAFTPPTAPLTNITNTSLLLSATNAGIYDAAAKNVLETVGNAQVSTTQAKFGTTSIAFDGTGDYLYIPQSNNPQNLNWELFKGDFTIEFFFRANSVTGIQGIIAKFNGNASARTDIQYLITLNGSSLNCNLYQSTTNNDITFTSSISTNTWYHVALVRSGTSVYAYLDGTRNATIRTITGDLNSGTTWPLQIGRYTEASANSDFNGYIDELRITKYARYSGSTITVPTAAFALQ